MNTKLLSLALAPLLATDASAQSLRVGSPAPALSVETWVQGDAVATLEQGQPYMVEFWATWCPPCIRSIPHLSKLQERYAERLTVIGVAGYERGDPAATLPKLRDWVGARQDVMTYRVAFDADGSMGRDWMNAAGQTGIPTAFLVDGEGRVAWIGSPLDPSLDRVVEELVEGSTEPDPADLEAVRHDLMVGDKAPAIAVGEWLKGEPIEKLRRGQVYVVEFWATWCEPCVRNMPHLTALQAKYGDDVRFVGVSVWEEDAALVAPFVKTNDANMGYTVARDLVEGDDEGAGRMAETWLRAAGENGIPAAFVVDREGRVAWIGHPAEIDGPLAQIVAGEWDLGAAAEEHARQVAAAARRDVLQAGIESALEQRDYAAVLEGLGAWARLDGAHAAQVANAIAWPIVDPEEQPPKADELDFAVRAARLACAWTERRDASILDTLACAIARTGDLQAAIAVQEEAVAAAGDAALRAELEARLAEFRSRQGQLRR